MATARAGTDAPQVRVVVLNFNGGDMVVESLRAILRTEWPADRLQVVCVDNASTDGSADRIERELPRVEVRRNPINVGFPGNNAALRDLDGIDHVALVNNDAYVEPGWLAPLVDELESDAGVGAACPKILLATRFVAVSIIEESLLLGVTLRDVVVDGVSRLADVNTGPDGREGGVDGRGPFESLPPTTVLQIPLRDGEDVPLSVEIVLSSETSRTIRVDGGAGVLVRGVGREPVSIAVDVVDAPFDVINNVGSIVFDNGYGADRGWLERDLGQLDSPHDVFAWCGGAVLLRADYLRDVGLFDESFFLYYEDTDLSWRGLLRGWRHRTVPTSIVRHEHSATTGQGSPLFAHCNERNRLLLLVKDAPWSLVIREVLRYVASTGSYAWRDIVAPLRRMGRPTTTVVRRRLAAYIDFWRMVPGALRSRRSIRARRLVTDLSIRKRLTDRPL